MQPSRPLEVSGVACQEGQAEAGKGNVAAVPRPARQSQRVGEHRMRAVTVTLEREPALLTRAMVFEVERADERRQAAQEQMLGIGEQRVRPLHRRSEGLLALKGAPASAGEKPKTMVEHPVEGGQWQRT